MVALQIRDVPDDIRQTLAERAEAAGQSLQAYLLALVTAEARRAGNVSLLQRFSGRTDGSRLTSAQAQQLLDDARREREGGITGESDPQ